MKKRGIGIISLIVLFQISILICGIFSDSYLIKKSSGNFSGSSVSINSDKIKEFMDLGINLLIATLSIKQIGTVSAAVGDAAYCCPETTDGGICETYSSEEQALCNDPIPVSCDNFNECGVGCCYDSDYGTCTTSSTKSKCESEGGEWNSDRNCAINECRQGGCILGSSCYFETEKQCELRDGIWDSSLSDPECAAYSLRQIKGACVYEDSNCRIKTSQECITDDGTFYNGYLCSNPDLDTICEKQEYISCVEGRDEIFWFDSCGNMENIYSSDKDASWNNGLILSKENSCGNDEGNAGSKTCGNCLSPISTCSVTNTGVKDGDFICKDLSCNNAIASGGTTKDRINGETWCVYEGSLEFGKAVVGSEHWLFSCVDGEVVLQDHSNQRTEICMEHTITENSKSFTIASMVANNHESCIYYNDEYADDQDMLEEKCNADYSCYIKNVNIDDYFKISMCLPKYPKGAELKDDSGYDENFCYDIGSYKCTVYYEKNWLGNWRCKENCDCEKSEFAEKMQEFCIGSGDCGTYVNYVGDGTDNVKINGRNGGDAPSEKDWTDYVKYATTNPNAFIDSKDAEEYFLEMIKNIVGGADWENLQGGEKYQKVTDVLKWTVGGLGLINIAGSYFFGSAYVNTIAAGQISASGQFQVVTLSSPSMLACVGGAVVGFAAGAFLGDYLAKKLDRTGPAATTMVLSAGVAGAVIGYAVAAQSAAAIYPYGTAIAIIAAFVLFIIWISGWGKTKEKYVYFTCRPWQAPTENYDCSDCNKNSDMPCTKYRCESLGQRCHLLNEDEENPICEELPKESNPPVLTLTEISEGYSFTNFENKRAEILSDSGSCIQELTEVKIKFNTDEFAQCKWSFETSSNYDLMEENYPDNGYSFARNHSMTINFPSLESLLDSYDIQGDISKWYGDVTIYLRCQDGQDPPNFNFDEYMIKFCINTEPDRTAINYQLTKANPKNGASLKYGTTEQYAIFYLHKPAECRYSTQRGISYDEMTGLMNCDTDVINGKQLLGWPCTTTFDNLVAGENNFYIKCKAQPWLVGTDEESERAVNVEDYEYKLYVSANELKIDSVLPQEEVTTGFEPVSISLQVKTSGGIKNGISTCSYLWGTHWIPFKNTNSTTHSQSGWSVMGGNHAIQIQCQDSADNIATGEISFKVIVDNTAPKVVRAYHEDDELKIITDEEAKCYYDLDGCYFNLEDGISMTSSFSTMHTTSWNPSVTYYIKCKDMRENINSDCAIKIIPGS